MGAVKDEVRPEGGEDLSMEEILQSIRKIIAEDDGSVSKPAANGTAAKEAEQAVPGSDVLELTEMVKDDGTVESLKPGAAAAASGDVLSQIDAALGKDKAAAKPAEAPPAAAAPAAAAPPPAAPVAAAPATPVAPATDQLLSADTAAAAAASLKKLQTAEPPETPVTTTPAPPFRDGTTVEDLVAEMLKPMMKAWLDVNLPPIVERIVEREVRKLTRQ